MKRISSWLWTPVISSVLSSTGLTVQADDTPQSTHIPAICYFTFETIGQCEINTRNEFSSLKEKANINNIQFEFKNLNEDTQELLGITVYSTDAWEQKLTLKSSIEVYPGQRGLLLYQDINFDHHPDIALQTSLGLANWYFDYWVYSPVKKEFIYVGHFPKLMPDYSKKQLSAKIRENAEIHKEIWYEWQENSLNEASSKILSQP